jgi:DNA-binding CsgD family transcriptional regulator
MNAGGRRGMVIVVARDAMHAARVQAQLHDLAAWRIRVMTLRQLQDLVEEYPDAVVLTALTASETRRMVRATGGADSSLVAGAPLTSREREILEMIADGAHNRTIATRLGISRHTVKFHVTSILTKLGAASRTEAVALALRRGLLAV